MRWKQYLTPVKSFATDQARKYMADKSSKQCKISDVRQPSEYAAVQNPGATLIPLTDPTERLEED